MNIHPVRDQVVVTKQKETEKVSAGGIITVSVAPKNVEGTVVAVGSGRVTMSGAVVPLEVVAGDKVLFNPSQATEVSVDGNTFLVLREDAVIVLR
jgi:chaperonin GroES